MGLLSRLQWLIYRWLSPMTATPWRPFPVEAYSFLSAWMLSDMTRYVIISLSALGLAAAALICSAKRQRGRAWQHGRLYLLIAALVSVLTFPFVMRYRPAVGPSADVEMALVDKPGLLTGAVKSCQAVAEVQKCTYEPLGWAGAQTLVYRKWCAGHYNQEGTWQPGEPQPPQAYRLDTDRVSRFDGSLDVLWGETCPPATCVCPALAPRELYEQGYYPGQYEEALISPDGRWVAFTAEYIYGPEDLLIISNR